MRFRYGVGDWKQGGRNIVPWRHKFAHYDYDLHKWLINDNVPQDWPSNVKTILTAKGPAAYGSRSQAYWFIFFENAKNVKDAGSFIFLYNEKTGYASRKGGPVFLE